MNSTATTPATTANLEMGLNELKSLYQQVTGLETRCPNKKWLVNQINTALAQQAPEQPDEQTTASQEEEQMSETREETTQIELADELPPADEHLEIELPAELVEEAREEEGQESGEQEDEASSDDEGSPETAARKVGPGDGRKWNDLSLDELHALHLAEVGRPTKGSNRKSIIWRIQQARAGKLETGEKKRRSELTGLTIEELQAKHLEVVGRPSSSTDRDYLINKIRAALRGDVKIGARAERADTSEQKPVTFRMGEKSLEALDAAWERLGFKSRAAFLHAAIAEKLAAAGETDAANLIAGSPAEPEAEGETTPAE